MAPPLAVSLLEQLYLEGITVVQPEAAAQHRRAEKRHARLQVWWRPLVYFGMLVVDAALFFIAAAFIPTTDEDLTLASPQFGIAVLAVLFFGLGCVLAALVLSSSIVAACTRLKWTPLPYTEAGRIPSFAADAAAGVVRALGDDPRWTLWVDELRGTRPLLDPITRGLRRAYVLYDPQLRLQMDGADYILEGWGEDAKRADLARINPFAC
jgi:hypothetical protein